MKTADTTINSTITIKCNYQEREAFHRACKAEGKPGARVLREYMRRYVKAASKK